MEKYKVTLSNLWTAWPIAGPWHLFPLHGGTNNHVWRVVTADEQSYVLRLLPDATHIPRIRYEAALLRALSDKQLPFLLPLPLQSNNGDIIVPCEQETGASTIATLSPFLPGCLPDRNDHTYVSQAATTLALLDNALATLPEISLPVGFLSSTTFGDLTHCHALVPDPFTAVEQLPIDSAQSREARTYLTSVMEKVDNLYKRLPQQLLHRDYDPGNILMDEQHMTAVLDFEFAGRDIRVLDLCVALSWWPVNLMGTGKEWDLIDTFSTAYIAHFPLSEEELLALPDVLRLRDVTSLIHRMGRYFAGLETDTSMTERVKFSLWREAWLVTKQDTLLHHALTWVAACDRDRG